MYKTEQVRRMVSSKFMFDVWGDLLAFTGLSEDELMHIIPGKFGMLEQVHRVRRRQLVSLRIKWQRDDQAELMRRTPSKFRL